MWSLHPLPVSVWVPSGHSSLLSQSKGMQVGLTGDSKLPVGVNVSVSGPLSLCQLCDELGTYLWCTPPSPNVS